MTGKIKDITGQKFGRLIVIGPTEKRTKSGKIKWECICTCGKQCFVRSDSLKDGTTKSCGCLKKELTIKRFTKHGKENTPIYWCWFRMLARCENPKDPGYKWYGGRGISVCERWHDFRNFYADVGDRPEGVTLDRWPDNDGNYEPDNWRWATWKEQQNNKRPRSCGPSRQRWFFAYNESAGEWVEDNSQKEFAQQYDLRPGDISACLNSRQKTCGDWTFQWLSN